MPRLELTGRELIVHLRWWESLLALRPSVRVPLAHVRGATEDNGFRGLALGLRIPGTHVPGVISAGTFLRDGDKQFVFIRPRLQTVVIEMTDDAWTRLIIGVRDARAEAARINAAISAR
jgi:hypothetical protein